MSLIVFPAIDLKNGQVVRLAEGDMDRATVYGDDPAAQAALFAQAGAQHLHVVDLDGSFAGHAVNAAAVERIVETFPGHVQLGGGLRNREAVERWFDLGVSRIVIGTAALKDPAFVKLAARDFPGGIVVAVDARDGMVATDGWAEKSDMPVIDLARRFEDAGVASLPPPCSVGLPCAPLGPPGAGDRHSGDRQRRRGGDRRHQDIEPARRRRHRGRDYRAGAV